MKLTQIKGNTWCLEGVELIPVYRMDEHRCILLDSGWPREREELKAALEREGLRPVAAIGSHAHTDHVGNHSWLKEEYGALLYMSEGEAVLVSRESRRRVLADGAKRMEGYYKDIDFMVDRLIGREDGIVRVLGIPFYIHHTPGHSADHICVGTPDGVCYLGDLLMAGEALERARMPYHFSHSKARLSMEKMRAEGRYDRYIAAHRGVVSGLDSVVEKNLAMLDRVEEEVLTVLKKPLTWEEWAKGAMEKTHLVARSKGQEMAYREFIRLAVDSLLEQGRVEIQTQAGEQRFYRRG